MLLKTIFGVGLLLQIYHILLFPLLLWIYNKLKQTKPVNMNAEQMQYPSIAVICAAYNEQEHIGQKIQSFLDLDYPKDKIKLIIISDDSSDDTNDIVQSFSDKNVELIIQKPRGGKQRAHNLIEPSLSSDFIMSTDANTIFEPDAVKELVSAITSNSEIGLVSGELRLIKAGTEESGEGLYWKFESFLKQQDSDFHSIIGANGSIFLIRRDLFTQIDPASVDDFERTLYVLSSGFKAKYAPAAKAYEEVTEYAREEFSRKVRIITQEWFALFRNIALLNPFRHFKISLILISHKVIRWLLFVFTFMTLAGSMFIPQPFYMFMFWVQILFYSFGALELAFQKSGKRIPLAGIPAYFLTMNIASLIAFIRFLQNRNVGVWNPVRKQV